MISSHLFIFTRNAAETEYNVGAGATGLWAGWVQERSAVLAKGK